MRTKQSNTAYHPSHRAEFYVLRTPPRGDAAPTPVEAAAVPKGDAPKRAPSGRVAAQGATIAGEARSSASATAEEDEGLLHDAGNLIGAVALYCDLLSMPNVLRSEHRHYADELRLLGERSAAMIDRLMERRTAKAGENSSLARCGRRSGEPDVPPVSCGARAQGLRPAVERCVGVLDRIAQEHAVEVAFGEAAALPVRVPAESVERILINLVRNAAAAMPGRQGPIRIGVGLLPGAIDGMVHPWPFQRVQLTVEDCGCGMEREELERLLGDAPLSTRHGIGFRVVRELVNASGGELDIRSQPGRGTRI